MTTVTLPVLHRRETVTKIAEDAGDRIHCDNCGETWDADDWSRYDCWDPQSVYDHFNDEGPYINSDNWDDLHSFFTANITSVTMLECPSGCHHMEGGDGYTEESGAVYECPSCEAEYNEPHEALTCCEYHQGFMATDICLTGLKRGPENQPILFGGAPIGQCECHEDCQQYICLYCHMGFVVLEAARNHWVSAHIGVQITGNFTTESIKPKVSCLICTDYCCAIHKTHHDPHRFCWEGLK